MAPVWLKFPSFEKYAALFWSAVADHMNLYHFISLWGPRIYYFIPHVIPPSPSKGSVNYHPPINPLISVFIAPKIAFYPLTFIKKQGHVLIKHVQGIQSEKNESVKIKPFHLGTDVALDISWDSHRWFLMHLISCFPECLLTYPCELWPSTPSVC